MKAAKHCVTVAELDRVTTHPMPFMKVRMHFGFSSLHSVCRLDMCTGSFQTTWFPLNTLGLMNFSELMNHAHFFLFGLYFFDLCEKSKCVDRLNGRPTLS